MQFTKQAPKEGLFSHHVFDSFYIQRNQKINYLKWQNSALVLRTKNVLILN